MLAAEGVDMTSDSHDDLEQALRETLKLRRELAANVTRGGGSKPARWHGLPLGLSLYWACIGLAVCWMLGLFIYLGNGSVPNALDLLVRSAWEDPLNVTLKWLVVTFPALILYGLGRAFRDFRSTA